MTRMGSPVSARPLRADAERNRQRILAAASTVFAERGLDELAARAARSAAGPAPRWVALGITQREEEVLALVADGLANKEVASRLSLSVRTVEKHVEALLRKTSCASRTQLVALVRSSAPRPT